MNATVPVAPRGESSKKLPIQLRVVIWLAIVGVSKCSASASNVSSLSRNPVLNGQCDNAIIAEGTDWRFPKRTTALGRKGSKALIVDGP